MLLKDILKPFPIGTCFLVEGINIGNIFTVLKISNDRCILHAETEVPSEISMEFFLSDYIIIDTVQEAIFREDMRRLLE